MWEREGGEVSDADGGVDRWERGDGYAVVTVRETATGAWAVTLDRLAQAPEGETYERETVPTREDALALAERWRDEHDE